MLRHRLRFLLGLICWGLGTSFSAVAQELRATVQVLSPGIQNTSKQVFTTLETAVREYLNSTQWTRERYEADERIECSFVFNITEQSSVSSFKATLQVQYSRPVFNSSYKSPVLNLIDKQFSFTYLENDRIEFVENTHLSNLSSVLAYYAYIIVGLDHDTFEKGSGEPFYAKAQGVVNNAQNDPQGAGWRSLDGNNNRFWLVDNLLNPAFDNLIEFLYTYHRQGLDVLHDAAQQKTGKAAMANSIAGLRAVHQKRPNSYLMGVVMDAKSQEIVSVFGDGAPVDLKAMQSTLLLIDANNSQLYQALGQPK